MAQVNIIIKRLRVSFRQPSKRGAGLFCFLNFAGTQAAGADLQFLGFAGHRSVNGVQVGVPAPGPDVMGVTDCMPETDALAADLANITQFISPY
jgi:hypothetical protein